MAKRYPGARFKPLGKQTESRMRSHDIVCVHTMVGSLEGVARMFAEGGFDGTESHFGIGGDGTCEQWQDLAFSADANLDGWHRVISIENADSGPGFPAWSGSNVPRFTKQQAAPLVDLLVWLCSKEAHADCPADWTCHREGIPLELIPDSKPGRRGIGVHRQGVDGNFGRTRGPFAGRVPGGERWSSSAGKVCPGDNRIAQLVDEIIPAVQERLTREEDDMPRYTDWPKEDREALARDVADAVLSAEVPNRNPDGSKGKPWTLRGLLANLEIDGDKIKMRLKRALPEKETDQK